MGDFLHGANGILRDRLSHFDTKHETWDLHVAQLRFDWGGHVARLQNRDFQRIALRVFSIGITGASFGKSRAIKTVSSATIDISAFGDGATTCTDSSV